MAEVPEHRAVRLVEFAAQTLAVGGVALGEVDRDHAVVVTDHDVAVGAREQVEAQPPDRVASGGGILADHGEAQRVELDDQVPLGALGDREVGHSGRVGVIRAGFASASS